jgi:hypothetical protein
MGVMHALARLDAVVLPRLARGARRIDRVMRRRRTGPLTAAAVGLALVVGAVVVAQVVGHNRPTDRPDQAVRVGVRDGDWIPGYLDASRQRMSELASAAPNVPVYALVSLRDYLTPDQVAALVRTAVATTGAETSGQLTTVYAKARVPIKDRQTEIVTLSANRIPDDLVSTMAIVAAHKDADAARYAAQAAGHPGSPDEVSADLARSEAQAYRNRCACIYALVVRGVPASLSRLAAQPDTRVVDPAPQVTDPAVTAFVPPLPEQTDTVVPPADGPFPSRTPA